MTDGKNLILALVLSAAVLFGWQYFVGMPQMKAEHAREAQVAQQKQKEKETSETAGVDASISEEKLHLPLDKALKLAPARVAIDTVTLDGSLNLAGARFDNLQLKKYRETVDPKSPEIVLLAPLGSKHPYYAEFGWIGPEGYSAPLPGAKTPWKLVSGSTLSPGHDVTLTFDNGQGLVFTRHVAVDADYLFTITDRVENHTAAPTVLYPYALISRRNLPKTQNYFVLHEGFIGIINNSLKDPKYDTLASENKTETFTSTGGWLGITDKYWMAAIIPQQDAAIDANFDAHDRGDTKVYQADYRLKARSVAPGAAQEITHKLFAGAKVLRILEKYRDQQGVARFDYAIDWGWFFFLTKPFFLALEFLYRQLGNFGVAIMVFTLALKLLFFPLQSKSYRSMARMKKLQPEMERLRELHKADKVAQQQAILELYRREKANPLGGCLPILIQIPVFFSLYKVLVVSIEMRHAPFFGWIRDLSAPDPTSYLNLFGLLPFVVPTSLSVSSSMGLVGAILNAILGLIVTLIHIGVWPLLMGCTMWLQTKLNPPPTDPTQAKIFGFMPWIFMVMMASFPAGLVIYWTFNNVLSIAQQMLIMKSQGVRIDAFDRLKAPFMALLKRGESKPSQGS